MSTNDAAKSEPRVVGGESTTQLYRTAGATRTTRKLQDETFDRGFRREKRRGTQTGQHFEHSPTGREKAHTELILGSDRQREEDKLPGCGDPKLQTRRPVGTRFTSFLTFKLSTKPGSAQPGLKPAKKPDPCPHSVTGPLRGASGERYFQVNGRASPAETHVDAANDLSSSEKISFPVQREEDVITLISNVLETTSTSEITHSFSDGEPGPCDCNGLRAAPHGSQPRRTCLESFETGDDIKDLTRLENQNHLVEPFDPTTAMLSSTMVSVLAPHWNGRLRRSKRGMAAGDIEGQGNLQGVTYGPNTEANSAQERFQETRSQQAGVRGLRDGTQDPLRAPFLGTERKKDWSTKSGPPSINVDYECKRKVVQSVSVDGPGRLDNRKMDKGASSAMFSLSLDVNGQGRQGRPPLTGHQGELSPSSSKPTTSSHLLSLRRLNSNLRSSLPETNPVPHLSPTLLNNNEQERFVPYSSTISYKTTETSPSVSPSSPNYRERGRSKTPFFSALPKNKDSEDAPFSQIPQTTRIQTTFSCPEQTYLTRGLSEKERDYEDSDKRTDNMSESSLSSPRLSPYDHYSLKSRSLPRRTTLTSTSWWKQVAQESSSSPSLNDTANINNKNKNKTSSPVITPRNNKSDLASQNPTDYKRFSQIPSNRDNNNTVESVYKGNLNIVMKTQGGSHTLRRSNAEDTPDQELDRFLKQPYSSNLNVREPQHPRSLLSVPSSSKFNSSAEQTTLTHSKDVAVTELQNTLLNPKRPNTPTEKNDLTANNQAYPALFIPPSTSPTTTGVTLSKTTSCTDQPGNKSPDTLTKQSLFKGATNIHSSQTLYLKAASSPPPSPNTKTSSSSNTQPLSSQISIPSSVPSVSPTRSVPNTLSTEFTMTTTATPLGFKRSYASIPKSLHPKTISTLIPTSHPIFPPKTNYSPVATSSTTSSTNLSSHPALTTPTSPSLLTPPITSSLSSSTTTYTSSSLLTPPATPTLTRPISPETAIRQVERTLSDSLDLSSKKQRSQVEGKRVRRVTWQDSVDLQGSEATTAQKSEPSQVPANPPSPSRPSRNVVTPSIFSFLRLGSSTRTTSPLCPPTPKTSSIQVWREGKHQRSLSSDSADKAYREGRRAHTIAIDSPSQFTFDHGGRETVTARQERTLSEDASPAHYHSSAPRSLPPETTSGYKHCYSSTPYSTLKSTRSALGEAKNMAPTSPLFQQTSSSSKSIYTLHPDQGANMTSSNSKLPLSPINLPQTLSPHFQNRTNLQESSKLAISDTDHANNNHCMYSSRGGQNGQMTLVDKRVGFSSMSLPLHAEKALGSHSPCVSVVETLVYNISKTDSTTTPLSTRPIVQRAANTQISVETKFGRQPQTVQSREVTGNSLCQLNQSPNGSSSKESQCPSSAGSDNGCSNRRMKESIEGKSTFFSVESKHDIPPFQSPRKGLFALKKSPSTPNSSLCANKEIPLSPERARPETERASKSSNKMDQVLSRLKQTFSSRRSDDDLLFPWRWKRPSQAPSVSGSSDISDVSDVTVESNKTVEEDRDRERGELGRDSNTGLDERDRWTENRYTLMPSSALGNKVVGDQFSIWSEKTTTERADYEPANQSPSCSDSNPARQQSLSPNTSVTLPIQSRKSISSPRSPFSPFSSSLSPLSPIPPADVTDDVFYSPKLQRRGDSTSPCELGEGIILASSRRSRASTGPSCGGQCQDNEQMPSYSSCADIKYGIEAGRSFSVSSVLSSRPSGPGRISTGSRIMSASDLSDPATMFGGHLSSSNGMGQDQLSVISDQTSKYDFRTTGNCRMSSAPSDPGKMRSRSLPRSLTRCLANWSSEVSTPLPVTPATMKPSRLWSPNLDTCRIPWERDTEGPPTPPPSPPWSPASRRISKPPSLSSPTSPSSPGVPQDCQSARGHLPSRGYVSSLSAFEESSDSSSDTTTDDEYYLETDEGNDKETEL